MKKIYTLFLTLLLTSAAAQGQTPGGVQQMAVWSQDTSTVKIPVGSGLTYVGVNKISNAKEQAIWSLSKDKTTEQILTTSRSANLTQGTFMNYAADTLPEMRLYSYTSSLQVGADRLMHIGRKNDKGIPVRDMNGGTIEYAVYNRRLSDMERCRVESYFALKYGITLNSSYLNSRGTTIWNAYTHRKFRHRVAGIITDTPSALCLSSSHSAEPDYFINISTPIQLSDGQSVLWGDDNGKLAFVPSRTYGKWMGRKWMVEASTSGTTNLHLKADARQIRQIAPLADGETFYLAIDSTGTGVFSAKTVQYHKATSVSEDSVIFKDITLHDRDVFTFRAAKAMFTTIEVVQPDSHEETTGSLTVRVNGGLPPYRMTLSREQKTLYDRSSGDSLRTMDHLSEGIYLLTTTDKLGNTETNEFAISTSGVAEIPMEEAHDESTDRFLHITAGPIPSDDGYVDVQVEMKEPSSLTFALFNAGGTGISTLSMAPDTYFKTRVYLPTTGVYLLRLQSGTQSKTVKLIRN